MQYEPTLSQGDNTIAWRNVFSDMQQYEHHTDDDDILDTGNPNPPNVDVLVEPRRSNRNCIPNRQIYNENFVTEV